MFKLFIVENNGNASFFTFGPFSKQMDLYGFLDLKPSEIGKLCSKLGNEVKIASFILH